MFYKLLFLFIICFANISLADNVEIKAIVNDEIITSYDVLERKKLSSALLKHTKIKMSDDNIYKNVFDEMIDDKIKIAEARKYNISATKDEIEHAKSNMVNMLKLGSNGYADILKEADVSEDVLNEQIRADVIWAKFVMQVLRAYIKVQDNEVNLFIDNMAKDSHFEYTLIPFILKDKSESLITKAKQISTCEEFENFANSNGEAGSGFKMNILDSQMQRDLFNLTKSAPLSTALDPIKLDGLDTIFFICDKRAYTPKVSNEEKENIKYMIFQNKLDAYANKYFEKIKANSIIDIKE